MMWKIGIPSPLLAALAGFMLAGCSVFGVQGVEEAGYTVLESDGDVEVRQYADYTIARTFVAASYEDMSGEVFGRLFDYISGDNISVDSIAMTAPVLMASSGQDIAMTAPVLMEADGEGWWMAFVLPEGMNAASAPRPADPLIEIVDIAGPRMASLRFSGWMDEETIRIEAERLRAWIDQHGLEVSPDYQVAGYDPPWTIPFLRRNEVLMELR